MSTAELLPITDRLDTGLATNQTTAPETGADFLDTASGLDQEQWQFSGGFPRLKSGLIDIDAYQPYLLDHPDSLPPVVYQSDKKGLRHQHLYFWRSFYRQRITPRPLRDLVLLGFWKAPYNQLLMRIDQEAKVHERFTRLVSPPPIETMRQSLADFDLLDRLGAAAVGRRLALVPEAFDNPYVPKSFVEFSRQNSPSEITGMFDDQIEKLIDQLEHPLVTPARVVTGAISRMGRLTNSQRLLDEARRRAEADPVFYPVRIRDARALAGMLSLPARRHLSLIPSLPVAEALQTEVNTLKSLDKTTSAQER